MRIAQKLGIALGVLVTAVGLIGMVDPPLFLRVGRSLQSPSALYVIAAIRIALGVLLFWAAATSRVPRTLRVVAVLVVAAGLITPLLGVERIQSMLTWYEHQGELVMRAIPGVAMVLGGILIHSFDPTNRHVA